MQNTEILDIEASLQTLVRRAYDLGRSDALKKVVDVLKSDQRSAEHLALMAPKDEAPKLEQENPPQHEDMNEPEPAAKRPWWARSAR